MSLYSSVLPVMGDTRVSRESLSRWFVTLRLNACGITRKHETQKQSKEYEDSGNDRHRFNRGDKSVRCPSDEHVTIRLLGKGGDCLTGAIGDRVTDLLGFCSWDAPVFKVSGG